MRWIGQVCRNRCVRTFFALYIILFRPRSGFILLLHSVNNYLYFKKCLFQETKEKKAATDRIMKWRGIRRTFCWLALLEECWFECSLSYLALLRPPQPSYLVVIVLVVKLVLSKHTASWKTTAGNKTVRPIGNRAVFTKTSLCLTVVVPHS